MQKPISILLSLLFLLSITGLTYGQHFCEGVVVDIALTFGVEKMNCGDVEANDSCDDSTQEADCCADVYYQIQTDKDFANKSFDTLFELPIVDNNVNLALFLAGSSIKQKHQNYNYLPPDFGKNLQSLYQVYLI